MTAYRREDDRLTACTPGSALGPTLGIEYGKPLPFTFLPFILCQSQVSSMFPPFADLFQLSIGSAFWRPVLLNAIWQAAVLAGVFIEIFRPTCCMYMCACYLCIHI